MKVANRAKLVMLAGTSLCLSFASSHAASLDPWVGWYAGGNFGYSWGKATTETRALPYAPGNTLNTSVTFGGAISTSTANVNGWIGGVQTGYVGRIAPHWLGGVETDFQWSGESGSSRGGLAGNATSCTFSFCTYSTLHDVTTRLNWFGTLRGRVGVEANGVWLYGTAGFAYGKVSVSGVNSLTLTNTSFFTPDVLGTFFTPYSYSRLKGGWTAGVGAEGLIGDGRWRWKVEYLHIDLGGIDGGIFAGPPNVQVNTIRFTDDIVRFGINYRFNDEANSNAMNAYAAYAAMPAKAPRYVKAPPPPVLGWTGWYVGVNAGYIDTVRRTNTDASIVQFSDSDATSAVLLANNSTNQFNEKYAGFLGGVQAGYNYQFSRSFVAGVEADFQGTSLGRDYLVVNSANLNPPFGPSWITTTRVSNKLDYLGTVRGRVGVTPIQSLMLYATGGLAYGGVRSNTQISFDNDGGAPTGTGSGSFSETKVGWTAGGGGEWMFAPNWSAKLEYLYYDLGLASYATGGYSVNSGALPFPFPGNGTDAIATRTSTRFEGNIVRVGVNYRFGASPVVAKY